MAPRQTCRCPPPGPEQNPRWNGNGHYIFVVVLSLCGGFASSLRGLRFVPFFLLKGFWGVGFSLSDLTEDVGQFVVKL